MRMRERKKESKSERERNRTGTALDTDREIKEVWGREIECGRRQRIRIKRIIERERERERNGDSHFFVIREHI